jgi:hypothetical protein
MNQIHSVAIVVRVADEVSVFAMNILPNRFSSVETTWLKRA